MAKVPYELRGSWRFRTPGKGSMNVSRTDLWYSAAVVGMPLLASNPYDERPLLEMAWRVLMVDTNLTETQSGWERSNAYDRLDPSEKGAVSYFLGMVQSHLVATKVMGFTHLVHVDRLLVDAGQRLTRSRPDFVAVNASSGLSRGYGATWEAKGRTRAFDGEALRRAKDQAMRTVMISGLSRWESIGSEAYFDATTELWEAALCDPEPTGPTLSLGLQGYLRCYYRTLVSAARQGQDLQEIDGDLRFSVPGVPLRVQVPVELVEAVDETEGTAPGQREEIEPMTEAYDQAAERITDVRGADLIKVTVEGEQVQA